MARTHAIGDQGFDLVYQVGPDVPPPPHVPGVPRQAVTKIMKILLGVGISITVQHIRSTYRAWTKSSPGEFKPQRRKKKQRRKVYKR